MRSSVLCRHPAVWLVLLLLAMLASLARAGSVAAGSLTSAALGADFRYTIYLPQGYASGHLRYPVLYLLHGHGGNERDWLVRGEVQPTLDRLIQEGRVPPVIVVMPGGANTWWVNGAQDRAEDALIQELIPHIDATFRTVSQREGRMIAGLSAGGFGTVNAVMKHPEMFASAAVLSPAIYNPTPPSHSSARQVAAFKKDGAFDQVAWSRLNYTGSFDAYKRRKIVVPLYIHSGDHDALRIAWEAASLFQQLWEYQPDKVELRIVDGDHEWAVWRQGIADAIPYMARFVSAPQRSIP